MRLKMKLLGSAGIVLTALVGVARSVDAQPAATDLKATVAVRITPTRQSDRPGGAAVSSDFVPGESKRLNVSAGRGDDLCVTGVWAAEPGTRVSGAFKAKIDEQEAAALYVWRFDVSMREVATDRIVFDLSWERISRLTPNGSLRGKQRLAFREGQSHPIDLIHGAQNSDCMSVVVDIIAHIHDDLALQGKRLEWDLWFSGAPSGAVHRALTSPYGESAAFQFDPIPLKAVQPGAKADGAMVHVYGQLRGRVRADGNIDVALTAVRYVTSDQNRSRPPRSLNPISNSGQKNFIAKSGEAVKIVLPSLSPAAFAANEMSITVQARAR